MYAIRQGLSRRKAGLKRTSGHPWPGVHSEEEIPFGGVKASGYGRFGGKTGVVELQSCDGSALRPPRSTARSDLPSWAVDETCLKVHGRWCYLSRTVDRFGTLVDVLFSEHRNM